MTQKTATIDSLDKKKAGGAKDLGTVTIKTDYDLSDFGPQTKDGYTAKVMAPGELDALKILRVPPIPFVVTQWRVGILVMSPPRKTPGGVLLTRETTETEALLSHVGVVVAMGANAFKSVTKAGINLADEPFNPVLGEYVLFAPHAGVIVTVRGLTQAKEEVDIQYRLMADSDILGITKAPNAFRYYL